MSAPKKGSPTEKCWSDVENPSVSAIFLWQGISADHKDGMCDFLGGYIGIADWLVQYANVCERVWLDLPNDLPGVFHYEIVESMGAWLADNHRFAPTVERFKGEIQKRTVAWMAKYLEPAG